MKKICVFGDSIGKGVSLPEDGRYKIVKPDVVGLTGEELEVKNYAVFGCTLEKALPVVRRHSGELKEYDSVFLELGGNDCDFDWQRVSDDPEGEHECRTPCGVFEKAYRRLIETIVEAGGNLVILTFPPVVAERYFRWISRDRNGENILRWLGGTHTIYRWQEMYNLKVVELAKKLDVKLIDIRSAFLRDRHYERLMCRDGIHPNEKGYELIYRTIAEEYRKGNFSGVSV
ncbi:MAG: SGNH/GDSL hydrolase family protein [Clostridia bacterium]|nr:SGNH/GDSL hydrolase family protein [Clostridia bacterium]